jgi:hypothetical protein
MIQTIAAAITKEGRREGLINSSGKNLENIGGSFGVTCWCSAVYIEMVWQ